MDKKDNLKDRKSQINDEDDRLSQNIPPSARTPGRFLQKQSAGVGLNEPKRSKSIYSPEREDITSPVAQYGEIMDKINKEKPVPLDEATRLKMQLEEAKQRTKETTQRMKGQLETT